MQLIRNNKPVKITFAFMMDGTSNSKAKPNNKLQSLNTFESDSDDIDEDDNLNDTAKANKPKRKLSDREELEKKCAVDLKFKVMELCAIARHQNFQTIFNAATLKQMVSTLLLISMGVFWEYGKLCQTLDYIKL